MTTDKEAKAPKDKPKPNKGKGWDIADHLEGAADALPDLEFDSKGRLISKGKPSKGKKR